MPRVDQPDVDLDEDDVPAAEEEAPEEAMDTNEQQETAKKQFKLSYEKYKKISFLIIEHIRWALRIDYNVPFYRSSLRKSLIIYFIDIGC